jgi:3-oxoacyl-[acyl-carrier-protein] synthase-3
MTRRRAGIVGTGSALPSTVLTNAYFENQPELRTSDQWIVKHTGIRERRKAAPGEGLSLYATEAAKRALEMANLAAEELDLIICGTFTPDTPLPGSSNLIQANLAAKRAAAFDLQAACSGFVYTAVVAQQFIETGTYRRVLAVGADLLSRVTDFTDRTTCILFGDGAGAAVMRDVEPEFGILASNIHSDGSQSQFLTVPAGGSLLPASHETVEQGLHAVQMEGKATFKIAVRSMARSAEDALKQAGYGIKDVNLFIAHQANKRITDAVVKHLGLSPDRAYENIERVGNTSAGSIPIALDEAVRQGRVRQGDLVLLTAFGGGLTWGSVLLRWAIK